MAFIDRDLNHRSTIFQDSSQIQPLGVGGSWNLDFYDDFSTFPNGVVDPGTTRWDHWNVNTLRRAAMNRAENAYIANGVLNLRVTTSNIGYGSELSAGGLETGYYMGPEEFLEARLAASGWVAFWSQTYDGMWGLNTPPDPADGAEYDILEQYGGDSQPIQENVHWGGYDANHQSTGHNITTVADKFAMNTYGFWRSVSGGFCKFYVNGVLDYTFTTIVSTRTDHGMRLTVETDGGITSCLTKVAYAARWTAP